MNAINNELVSWSGVEEVAPGILVYHDVLPKDLDLINRLESVLDTNNEKY